MKNLASMMKQAQEMKKNMADLQDRMEGVEMEGSAGGGLVTVTMSGKSQVRRVSIKPEAVDVNDIETLEDLMAAAFNDAYGRIQAHVQEEMSKITGGLSVPGM